METQSHIPPQQRRLCVLTVLGKRPSCLFRRISSGSTPVFFICPRGRVIKLLPRRRTGEILQPWPGSRTLFPNIAFTPSVYFEWSCSVCCYFYCISDLRILDWMVKLTLTEVLSVLVLQAWFLQGPLCPLGLCCMSDICFEWAFPLLIFRQGERNGESLPVLTLKATHVEQELMCL